MAVSTATLTASATMTIAELRLIVQHISNCLTAGGFTKVVDASQIDTAAFTLPALSNAAGYEMRQMTDALQATAPLFVKIEYGLGAQAQRGAIWITVGTSQNGSGTIGGSLLARTMFDINAGSMAAKACHVAAGTNYFCYAFNMGTVSGGGQFGLERSVDSDGTPNADGFYILGRLAGAVYVQYVPRTGSAPAAETSGGMLAPGVQTTGLHSNGNIAVYPNFMFGIGETKPPTKLFVGAFANNHTGNNTYTVNILGSDQTMIYCENSAALNFARGGTPAASVMGMLMKYE